MRTMYDSISPAAIPRDAQMVAGYIDGLYAWKQADWDRFPNAVKVTITALGLDHGVCLNLEPNGYWPVDLGVGWVQRARKRGVDPSIYCNHRNHLHLVRAAFDKAGVKRPHFWVAEYDGIAVIPAGCIAKQHSAPEGTGRAKAPAHYDISIVAEHWPGVDGDDDMQLPELLGSSVQTPTGRWVYYKDALGSAPYASELLEKQVIPRLVGLSTAMTAIAENPAITPEALDDSVDRAVQKHTPTAGEVAAAQLPHIQAAVREVLGADNEDTVEQIVQRIGEKLAGGAGPGKA